MIGHSQTILRCVLILVAMPVFSSLVYAQHQKRSTVVVRVMTYNIRHSRGVDEIHDLRRIAALIRKHRVDVVALQEVDVGTRRVGGIHQPKQLAAWTGMNFAFSPAISFQNGLFGNAILSRFPILSQQNRQVSGKEGAEERTLLEVKLQITLSTQTSRKRRSKHSTKRGGTSGVLTVWNTHFDYQSEAIRVESVQRIQRWFTSTAEPFVFLGDLNAEPDSESMKRLRRLWRNVSGSQATPTIPSKQPTQQLDYIWYVPSPRWKLRTVRVLSDPVAVVASDHRPLLAEFAYVPYNRPR